MSIETTDYRLKFPSQEQVVEYSTNNFSLLLSPSGQKLLRDHPRVMHQLHQYRKDFQDNRDGLGLARKQLAEGKEGNIFTIDPPSLPLAVKEFHLPFRSHPEMPIEKQTAFLRNTLHRAEQMRTFCQNYAPDYVRVPDHYGLLFLPQNGGENARECLLFMQKVNGKPMDTFSDPALSQQVAQDWLTDIKDLLEWDYPRAAPGFFSHPLAPDLIPQNVLVDISSPTSQRDYTLWIIDQ